MPNPFSTSVQVLVPHKGCTSYASDLNGNLDAARQKNRLDHLENPEHLEHQHDDRNDSCENREIESDDAQDDPDTQRPKDRAVNALLALEPLASLRVVVRLPHAISLSSLLRASDAI